ncbi:MAG: zf-HC2 domain-containing protein [Acidobacteria bacterium]|nr:zf-HC2 domain-containing protein [Acidobacteriota bacterium]
MTKHIADEQDALLDYLYDEGDAAERLRIARHLQDCATCSVAVIELQSVRGMLTDWTPPDARLGFRVVDDRSDRVAGSPSFFAGALRSAWAQAAAAAVLFASGMAVSQLRVEYGNGALTVRTRSAATVSTASVATPVTPPTRSSDITLPGQASPGAPSDFGGLEQELRSRLASSGDAPLSDDVLARVKSMIDQSEVRQRRELALRLADVVRDFDAQRRADLVQVQQNFGELEGQTGAEVAHQRELLNYLVRTSGSAPGR